MSLSRIIVIIVALIVASVVACAALAFGIIAADMDSNPIERVSFFAGSFFATSYFGAVTIVPAFVLIVLGETLRMRSVIYYGAAGALVSRICKIGIGSGCLLHDFCCAGLGEIGLGSVTEISSTQPVQEAIIGKK
jgi:hypothetical protein